MVFNTTAAVGGSSASQTGPATGTAAADAAAALAARGARPQPIIGGLTVLRQYIVLGAVMLVMSFIAVVTVVIDNRQATHSAIYLPTGANMRMLTQRIAKSTQEAMTGNAAAFRQLLDSREQFLQGFTLLT